MDIINDYLLWKYAISYRTVARRGRRGGVRPASPRYDLY